MIAQPATWCLPVSQQWFHPRPQCWNHRCERHPSWWGPSLSCCPGHQSSAPMMWTIQLPVMVEKESQNCLPLVFTQIFLSFFSMDWCSSFYPWHPTEAPSDFPSRGWSLGSMSQRNVVLAATFHVFILLRLSRVCINGETWKRGGKVRQEDSASGEVIH